MKRWSIVLCSLVLLLFAAGCKGEGMLTRGNGAEVPLTSSEYVALSLEKASYQGDAQELTIVWHNRSDHEITFGAPFDIITVQDGKEISHTSEDIAFIEIAYILPARGSWEETYDLSLFDLTENVIYTFTADYIVRDGEKSIHGQARLDFVIGINDDIYDVSGLYVTVESCILEQNEVMLSVAWHNDTPWDAVYGSSYDIQRFDGEKWTSSATADICFTSDAYPLDSGTAPQTKIYTLTPLCYDIAPNETYRFVSECALHLPSGTQTKTVTVEFIV